MRHNRRRRHRVDRVCSAQSSSVHIRQFVLNLKSKCSETTPQKIRTRKFKPLALVRLATLKGSCSGCRTNQPQLLSLARTYPLWPPSFRGQHFSKPVEGKNIACWFVGWQSHFINRKVYHIFAKELVALAFHAFLKISLNTFFIGHKCRIFCEVLRMLCLIRWDKGCQMSYSCLQCSFFFNSDQSPDFIKVRENYQRDPDSARVQKKNYLFDTNHFLSKSDHSGIPYRICTHPPMHTHVRFSLLHLATFCANCASLTPPPAAFITICRFLQLQINYWATDFFCFSNRLSCSSPFAAAASNAKRFTIFFPGGLFRVHSIARRGPRPFF